ncbi:MAG: ABC transporter permease [Desulfurococcaceae archaeon]
MALRREIATLKRLLHYKSFFVGVILIAFFAALSIYAMVTWPYDEAIYRWNSPEAWLEYPPYAKPGWITLFTGTKELEGSLVLDSSIGQGFSKHRQVIERFGTPFAVISLMRGTIEYNYDNFPSKVAYKLFISTNDTVYVNITWRKPSGISLVIDTGYYRGGVKFVSIEIKPGEIPTYILSYVDQVEKIYAVKLNPAALDQLKVLFVDDDYLAKSGKYRLLKGTYELRVETWSGDINSTLDVKLIIYGTTYGVAGTDRLGRDLFMAIAWGAPIAISFGLTASLLTVLLEMIIAAISAWFGGIIDTVIQRVNETFMILPFLPTIIMLWLFYGFTLWTLLWIIVLFNAWSGGLKSMRAMFLQIKEMPYIEAARAYGAGNFRIIFRYMVPRVLPVLIPNIVTAIPNFVFLEAALAIMGISDPRVITWGKILDEAYKYAALPQGYYHWILAPALMLFLMAIAFASIGFTLDRVFNPRLREV